MSEMVERVAKALEESFKTTIEASSGFSFADTGVSLPSYDIWRRYARAAIEAMRGMAPSNAVIDRFEVDDCHMSTYHCISSAWDSMIDEALSLSASQPSMPGKN